MLELIDDLETMALELEKTFSANNYQGNLEHEHAYLIKEGTIPVLVSCPHTVFHSREFGLKSPELHTGSLGLLLHHLTGCHLICSVRDDLEDPNIVGNTHYQQAVKSIVEKNDICLFIDIHGAAKHRPFSIDIGTNHNKTFTQDDTIKLIDIFLKNHIENPVFEQMFAATKKSTLTHFCSETLNIPALQLEFNLEYRQPTINSEKFTSVVSSMVEFIETFQYNKTYNLL